MRIDKFLKNSRIIKRRPVAKEACEKGRVLINGREAKPGDEVEPGDRVEVSFASGDLKFEVLKLLETAKKSDAESMYKVIQ